MLTIHDTDDLVIMEKNKKFERQKKNISIDSVQLVNFSYFLVGIVSEGGTRILTGIETVIAVRTSTDENQATIQLIQKLRSACQDHLSQEMLNFYKPTDY